MTKKILIVVVGLTVFLQTSFSQAAQLRCDILLEAQLKNGESQLVTLQPNKLRGDLGSAVRILSEDDSAEKATGARPPRRHFGWLSHYQVTITYIDGPSEVTIMPLQDLLKLTAESSVRSISRRDHW